MARSPDWETIPMAEGGEDPVWPLPSVTPKFATWSLGGGRPSGCAEGKCERWHAGVDMTGAPDGALVIVPEDARIVGLDKGWTDGTRAIFLRTDSGLFLVLGGVVAGSHKEFGHTTGGRVRRGEKLGRIVGSYGMLHFETYAATPDRLANSRWWTGDPPPAGLLNPTNYIERMVGAKASLLQTRQRLEALKTLGHYDGDVAAAWGEDQAAALKAAQAALGVTVDGKWGPETEDAVQRALQQACTSGACREIESAEPTTPQQGNATDPLGRLRIVGGVVAGVTVAGIVAAVVVSRARRPAAPPSGGQRDGV
jgi:peptidoglycan hydrolase-like protein with peptidoglycan-binding domain